MFNYHAVYAPSAFFLSRLFFESSACEVLPPKSFVFLLLAKVGDLKCGETLLRQAGFGCGRTLSDCTFSGYLMGWLLVRLRAEVKQTNKDSSERFLFLNFYWISLYSFYYSSSLFFILLHSSSLYSSSFFICKLLKRRMVQYFVIKLYLITCFRGTYEHLYQNIISRHKCLRTFPICTRKDVNFGRVEKLLWKFLHDPYSGYQVWSSVYFFHSVTCVSLCMGGSVLVTWSIPTYARNFLKICILFCRYDFSWVSSLQNIPNDLWYREGENELIYNEYMLRKSLRQWYKSKM